MSAPRTAAEEVVLDGHAVLSACISILTDRIPSADKNTLYAARSILGAAIGRLADLRRNHD